MSLDTSGLTTIDPDNVVPIEFRILLKVGKTEDKTPGGIILLDNTKEKDAFHQVIAEFISCGEMAFTNADGSLLRDAPKPGDKVIVAKYAGLPVKDKHDNLYRFANDKDIVAKVKS